MLENADLAQNRIPFQKLGGLYTFHTVKSLLHFCLVKSHLIHYIPELSQKDREIISLLYRRPDDNRHSVQSSGMGEDAFRLQLNSR